MSFLGIKNHKIKRLKTDEDFDTFAYTFAEDMGYSIPASFLKKGKAWGVYRKGIIGKDEKDQWVAGYTLVTEHPLRSLQEIPEDKMIPEWNMQHIGEFSSWWISKRYMDTKYFALFLSIHVMWKLLWHKSKYYCYSYPISEVKLGEYYAVGKPIRLYSGPINRLEGHPENPEPENVELLTTWGIYKISLYRNLKYLKIYLKKLLGMS